MNRIDVLLVEYGQVRGEMARRAIVQSAIHLLVPVLVVALVPVYGWLGEREPLVQLAVPLVFTVLAWVHVGQDHSIINAATYLHRVVRPAVIAALPRGETPDHVVLGWSGYLGRGRRQERPGPIQVYGWVMRVLAGLGPAIGFTGWAVARLGWSELGSPERLAAVVLVVGHALAAAGVLLLTRSVAPGYRSITAADDAIDTGATARDQAGVRAARS